MRSGLWPFVLCLLTILPAVAQEKSGSSPADEKPRVFITDSQSWEISGASGGANGASAGVVKGGARPQTAEIIKTFSERCPLVIVNNKQDKADYIVLLDHEGGKGFLRHDNKVAVFNKDGDSIVSHSTMSLGSSVKDACEAITKDWPSSAAKLRAPAPKLTPVASAPAQVPAAVGKVSVSSNPTGADIEIDGSFVGTTPSMVELPPGEHQIAIKKSGYQPWQRKMKIMSGAINLSPDLEKAQ
ncbi:MAG: PEGA domain-containing protein [Acidobacteriia bacterium]|nr:PEGA domain-containing protein [Terriglobia bacterium]